jgi:hypothetical protein
MQCATKPLVKVEIKIHTIVANFHYYYYLTSFNQAFLVIAFNLKSGVSINPISVSIKVVDAKELIG